MECGPLVCHNRHLLSAVMKEILPESLPAAAGERFPGDRGPIVCYNCGGKSLDFCCYVENTTGNLHLPLQEEGSQWTVVRLFVIITGKINYSDVMKEIPPGISTWRCRRKVPG